MSFFPNNDDFGEQRNELNRMRMMRKHETMRDDYYRKKYENMRKRSLKAPVWLSLLIYAAALVIIYALFNGGSG